VASSQAVGGLILRYGRGRGWVGSRWAEIIPVAAAVGAFGLAGARGGSGFIAAFVGGTTYGWVTKRADATQFTEELGGTERFTLIVFGGGARNVLVRDRSCRNRLRRAQSHGCAHDSGCHRDAGRSRGQTG
jgi:hypothetical protein